MQLVHSSHASSLYSTRVLLACTTRTAVDSACPFAESLGSLLDPDSLVGTNFPADAITHVVSERLGPLLDPCSLADTNFSADATACSVFERLWPLLDPGSLAGTNCPADATACAVSERLWPLLGRFSGRYELPRRCYSLCSDDTTHDIPRSTSLSLVAAPSSLEAVSPKVPRVCAALKRGS